MQIKPWEYIERINSQLTRPKPKVFIKHYARFCLNRKHVGMLLDNEDKLNFFHKMHVGDEFFLSVLYPLNPNDVRDFDVTFDDWDYTIKEGRKIKNQKKLLYEEQEKKGINKSTEINELEKKFKNISKNPKTIVETHDDLDKIINCKSYFYRKFAKNSDIETYWNNIIKNS